MNGMASAESSSKFERGGTIQPQQHTDNGVEPGTSDERNGGRKPRTRVERKEVRM